MHRIGSRTYVGEPEETVTVGTRAGGEGQAKVFVNDVDMGPNAVFQLPPDPGGRAQWEVQLTGELGATCVVSIATVDGGADDDFLICQGHNPAPVHLYECAVAQRSAMRALSQTRSAAFRNAPGTSKPRRPATRRSAGNEGSAKKRTANKRVGKKRGAARSAKKGGRS